VLPIVDGHFHFWDRGDPTLAFGYEDDAGANANVRWRVSTPAS
jgi:hypothetical protein